MSKGFPLVAVPVVLAWLVGRGRGARRWQGALACAAVDRWSAGAASGGVARRRVDAVRYHLDRPVQIESSPAMVLLGLDAVGAGEAVSVSSHRSDGLLHPLDGAVAASSALVAGPGGAAARLLAARRRPRRPRRLVLAVARG